MVAVHDQPRAGKLGQTIDRSEAVAMAGRRLVRDQHIESLRAQMMEMSHQGELPIHFF